MSRREQIMACGLMVLSLALIWALSRRAPEDSKHGEAGPAQATSDVGSLNEAKIPHASEQPQPGESSKSGPSRKNESGAEGATEPIPFTWFPPPVMISPPKTEEEVSELVTKLADGDIEARKNAARRLGMYVWEHPDAQAILAMLQNSAVSDPSEIIRERIAMDFLNAKDSRSFDIALDRCENDPSEKVRMYVIESTHVVWDKDYEVFLMPELSGDEAAQVAQDRRERVRALLTRLRDSAADPDTIGRIDEMLKGR